MNEKQKRLGEMPIKKLLVMFSVPAIVGMMINALYNLVDAIFIGQGVGTTALGALGIAFPIQMIISAVALMVGVGAASIYSRALGSKDYDKAEYTVGTAYLSALIVVLSLTILLAFNLDWVLNLFGSTDQILPYAREYVSIILIGNVAVTFSMVSNNFFRGEGNPTAAMVTMIVGAGLNIILDPIFIFGFKWGIAGAATATVISQYLSALTAIGFMVFSTTSIKFDVRHLVLKPTILNEILLVGMPTFIRNVIGSVITVVVNVLLNRYALTEADATLYISIYGTVMRLQMFIFMPSFGVVQGLQPIAGFNYGAKKMGRVLEVMKYTLSFIIVYFTISFIFLELFPDAILSVFSSEDKSFIVEGRSVVRILHLMLPILGYQIIASSVYQALGKAGKATFIALSRQLIFFLPLVFILSYYFGVIGVWFAFPAADLLSTIISIFMYYHEKSVLRRLDEYNNLTLN